MTDSVKKRVTVLVPAFNEQESVPELITQLKEVAEPLPEYEWQFLFVDDGSGDATLEVLKKCHEQDPRVHYVSLSRNFGKESAMLAGLDNARGDCVIIMDADFQDPPTLIPDLLKEWRNGYQDVYARRTTRGRESYLRRHLSLLYYKMLSKMSNVEILQNVGDFRLLDRQCVDALCQLRESQRYTKGLFCWIGFRKKEILFERSNRVHGKSAWNMRKLTNLAVEGITSFSIVPLRISTVLGVLSSLTAFLYMIYFFVKTLLFGDPVQGFPTLIIVILLLGGMQLCSLGIIGEYVGRIFNETKNRPVYFISEKEVGDE